MLESRISQHKAAKLLGVSRATVARWLEAGLIPHLVINKRRVLTADLVESFKQETLARVVGGSHGKAA